ncbi:hypothetical protein TW95_gp0705 [Pandoravirus inopinatum]|uniref:Uncharacterized protein n=1 Tax=Pandoravirus inopinatum TaxID=1605721 RepID=A0A0B5J1N9_9VIRU|nr:hypothetical protein TW95_gp0705 [Pandoravirus inopinatum]AJF97439.1 hypothetical protein [Pandoravirus inopinatum]
MTWAILIVGAGGSADRRKKMSAPLSLCLAVVCLLVVWRLVFKNQRKKQRFCAIGQLEGTDDASGIKVVGPVSAHVGRTGYLYVCAHACRVHCADKSTVDLSLWIICE